MEPLREIRNRLLNGWQLSKMHTFEVAARHQSFALAAEELSLSPSAVSHRINQLEEELGIQLFVRSHRKVELTHEGKRVYWALKSSLDTLNQEILDIKNQELSGTLTLYSRPSIAQCWLVPALGDFTRRYPSISLTVLTGNDNVNLQRAGIDLAIYFDDAPSAQLTHHFLMDEEILPVCSPEFRELYPALKQIQSNYSGRCYDYGHEFSYVIGMARDVLINHTRDVDINEPDGPTNLSAWIRLKNKELPPSVHNY
ncbi:DNA-binding transcriptional regulator DsdC [Escherichia coli]|uniref:DNA-binding transcriptional regulator DsdC n=1 Tax=Escherichia coli TaxID=562 RepID=UPI0022703C17|nr:DNA-binding transcriptional regulator DsdC [Escherichia coli]HAW2779112.1 DNA-binding transcriptional regulator DsdC [Escherichia coli]